MVALKWTMKNHYDVDPGETFWAASDVGWVVGHSYICYAPLLHGCTTVLFEGKPVGTPDAGTFWRVIAEHGVAAMFTAPTAFRAIKKEDPKGEHITRYDLRAFRTLFLAGERADSETIKWAEANLKVPVYDHWWQTETGWPICGNPGGARRAAGEVRLAHRADAGLRPAGARRRRPNRCRPARRARSPSSCRCRPRACRRCGATTSASAPATSRISRATTRPRTPATWTRTATPTSWRAPTTSSTWPAIASRRGRWRRSSPGTRTWPSAPWSAWPTP